MQGSAFLIQGLNPGIHVGILLAQKISNFGLRQWIEEPVLIVIAAAPVEHFGEYREELLVTGRALLNPNPVVGFIHYLLHLLEL